MGGSVAPWVDVLGVDAGRVLCCVEAGGEIVGGIVADEIVAVGAVVEDGEPVALRAARVAGVVEPEATDC